MRKLLTGLTVAAALAFASSTQAADGLVDFTWNACTPIVQDVTTTVAGPISLYISVLGIDVPLQAYETTFIYGSATGDYPDAWAFDPTGCQGSSFVTIDHLAPAAVSKSCPTMQGASASVQVKDVGKVPLSDQGTGYLGTNMRVSLFNAFPNNVGGVPTGVTPLIGTRYFLERVLFDHTFSVPGATTAGLTCGGYGTPMCFKIIRANYLDLSGLEFKFGRNVDGNGVEFVTFNGGTACSAVPAKAATWGAIKSQYRN